MIMLVRDGDVGDLVVFVIEITAGGLLFRFESPLIIVELKFFHLLHLLLGQDLRIQLQSFYQLEALVFHLHVSDVLEDFLP